MATATTGMNNNHCRSYRATIAPIVFARFTKLTSRITRPVSHTDVLQHVSLQPSHAVIWIPLACLMYGILGNIGKNLFVAQPQLLNRSHPTKATHSCITSALI